MKNHEERINVETINEDNRKKQGKQSFDDCVLALSEKLELANTLLTTIFEATHEFIIFSLDTEYRYLSFNNRHKEIAKSQWGRNIALGLKMLDLIDNFEERKNMKSFFDRIISGEQFSSIEEYNDKYDTIVLGKTHWAPIKNNSGEITGLLCFIQDITEKKMFLKEMLEETKNQDNSESLTFCDHLTGAYNRKFYEKELKRLDDKKYYPLSIILLNINGRNQVNSQYGHMVGDVFIKKAVQILQEGCRGADVVARLDGDEFVILMPRTVGGKVERAIERIKKNMGRVKIKSITLSVSFGSCTKYEEIEDISGIFEMAERQLQRRMLLD